MELILISESKLKITLTAEDMEKYELDCDTIDYDNTETRAAFWQILDEAKHETGFDAAHDRVFIQVYPSRSGGCEMYVTKLAAMPGIGADLPAKRSAPPAVARSVTSARQTIPQQTRMRVALYVFESLDDMIHACRKLAERGFSGESAAYVGERGGCALTFLERVLSGSSLRLPQSGEYAFIEEYGTRKTGQTELAYIKEHGNCIEKTNAVGLLSSLA